MPISTNEISAKYLSVAKAIVLSYLAKFSSSFEKQFPLQTASTIVLDRGTREIAMPLLCAVSFFKKREKKLHFYFRHVSNNLANDYLCDAIDGQYGIGK